MRERKRERERESESEREGGKERVRETLVSSGEKILAKPTQ